MIRFAENLNKMIAAGLGGAMEAPSTEVAVGHRVRYMDASGPVATFNTNIAAPIRSLRVDMQPIQAGSGDPSPDNLRPITGRTEVTVERTGKNLLDTSTAITNAWNIVGIPNNLKPNTQYTFSINGSTSVSYSLWLNNSPSASQTTTRLASYVGSGQSLTFTTPSVMTEQWLLIGGNVSVSGGIDIDAVRPQVELGSTATEYEPYDGQSATVQLGQTVYGGTAEIISGQGESTMAMVDLGTLNWNGPSYERYYSAAIPDAMPNAYLATYLVCTCYRAGTPAPSLQNGQIAIDNQRRIFIRDSRFTDKSQIAAYLSGQYLCYRIATPTSLTLTPASLSTLKGDNTVWSDAGDVTLEYPYYEETEGY